MEKEEKAFLRLLFKKTLTTFLFIFFSTITASGLMSLSNLTFVLCSSFIGGGGYFAVELMKYYGLQPDKKVLTKTYHFLV